MTDMTAQQTMKYLKQVSELETSVYQQTTVRKKAYAELVMPNVCEETITKPITPVYPSKPEEPSLKVAFMEKTWIPMVGVFSMSGGLICFLGDTDRFEYLGVGFGIAILVMLVGFALSVSEYFAEKKQYPRELANYERAKKKADDSYNNAMAEYNLATMAAAKQFAERQQAAQRAYGIAMTEVKKLDGPLEETRKLLSKAYSADIIFPKYRNMIAMCTMYEYFASGRCTELMGPTGAYNLYEAELRQNIIINQLEKVNENLEQVKQNQYILYQGIAETNRILGGVSADIKGILSMTTDIAVSSRITAFCSQVTAANAQAQTYLAIMD